MRSVESDRSETGKSRHVPIEEMEFYRLYDEVSDWCWDSVDSWSLRAQRTMGEQLITAADIVCANLVEGDGRYGVADGLRFLYIARASDRESRTWLGKSATRKQISEVSANEQVAKLTKATKLLNALIRYRKGRGKFDMVSESLESYGSDPFVEE